MRILAISDIHGCNKTFQTLLQQLDFQQEDVLYLLGDYIDRGPNSKGVIDTIRRLKKEGYTLHCLRGNHEQMLVKSYCTRDPNDLRHWIRNGGEATLNSFGITDIGELPTTYFDFFRKLPFRYKTDDFIFVHAGFDLESPNPLKNLKGMIWARRWHNWTSRADCPDWVKGRVIIHGHTVTPKESIEERFQKLDNIPVLDIDAGCCFSHHGYLCAVDLTNEQLYFQKNCE